MRGYSCSPDSNWVQVLALSMSLVCLFVFNWNIIALQCRVSFCCMVKWICCMYTYILSLSDLPPTPISVITEHRAEFPVLWSRFPLAWPSSKKCTNNTCWRGVEKRESSYTVGGNVNWHSHCGEQYRDSLKTLKIETSYDPVIPLLAIYPEKPLFKRTHVHQCSLQHHL